ncbi:MAG: SDR family NAD(P)-dependent oxidoreductase [Rhodospirillaceae bacterium]|nr:SDR family NAD(P)-dependent oxidoreductase [Rhodospirillaceae bacterium]MDD9997616.1 SDR family NAD(P)-dependent oxidoreductase [Rhodospirillaceae bacterium]
MICRNSIDLHNRAAVVTGAARGLGFAVASRLRQSGANIIAWDLPNSGLDEAVESLRQNFESPGRVAGISTDIADGDSVAGAMEVTLQEYPQIDILINNAGISGPNHRLWEYPPDDWRRVIDVNLFGSFLVTQAVVPTMIANGYGRIVNIASVAGKDGNPNASAYSASKAGLINMTKSLGKELAGTGVLVNCVTPAAVRTPLFDQMSEEHVAYMLSKIPLQRFGEPEEIAALVAWLASEECSFSTGAAFDLSGGRATY